MKRVSFVAAGLLAISSTASAGGYLGLALGTEPALGGDVTATAKPMGRSLRGLAGLRFGNLAIEGAVNGFDVSTTKGDQTIYQLSGALKLSLPLGNNFEAFGRGGLERTWLGLDDSRYNLSGNGFLVGGGFEYRLNLAVTSASIFVDYTVHHANLENTRGKVDETSRIWALGFTVGI